MHEIIHALGFSRRLFDQLVLWLYCVVTKLATTNICRFVNEDGVPYNPVRSLSEPYGGEDIFTGPKV